MTQAPASIFKIPTESPQLVRGAVSRARKVVRAGRRASVSTMSASSRPPLLVRQQAAQPAGEADGLVGERGCGDRKSGRSAVRPRP